MILVDTSVWIDHFRAPDDHLTAILTNEMVLTHPFVIGEIMLGNMRAREKIAELLAEIPQVTVATADEVLSFIGVNRLGGRGIGYVDAHLLAAARLTPGGKLWSRDKRLSAIAHEMGIDYLPG